MAKGKYHRWLEPEGLLLLEGWARSGLSEEQIAKNRISEIAIVFERLPENVQSIVVDLYILKEKHREVADKYNYSRQSLYRLVNTAIKKATEK